MTNSKTIVTLAGVVAVVAGCAVDEQASDEAVQLAEQGVLDYSGFVQPENSPRHTVYGGQFQLDDCAVNHVKNPATRERACPEGYTQTLMARIRAPESRCGANQYICTLSLATVPVLYPTYNYQGGYQVDDCGRNSSNNPWTGAQSCPTGSTAMLVGRIQAPESRCGAYQYICNANGWNFTETMGFYGYYTRGDYGRDVANQFTGTTSCPAGSTASVFARTRQGDSGYGQVTYVCKPTEWGWSQPYSQFEGCRGDGLAVCRDAVVGYTRYFKNHPYCFPNPGDCAGVHATCTEECPVPTQADR